MGSNDYIKQLTDSIDSLEKRNRDDDVRPEYKRRNKILIDHYKEELKGYWDSIK